MGLRRAVRKLGRSAGLDVRRFRPLRDPELRLAHLCRERGVTMLVDVGANVGEWALDLRRCGFGGRIVSIEPNPAVWRELEEAARRDGNWDVHRVAAGHANGEAMLRLTPASTWSSLLPQSAANPIRATESAEEHRVPLRRLDDVLSVSADERILLKLDVQGYELPALAGARGVLSRVELIEAEACLVPLYEGQSRPADLITAIEGEGFRLAGIFNGHIRADGEETFIDLIFARAAR